MKIHNSVRLFLLATILLSMVMGFLQTLSVLVLIFLIPILYCFDKNKIYSPVKKYYFKSFLLMFSFIFIVSLFSTSYILSSYPLEWMGITNNSLGLFIVLSIWILFSIFMAIPMAFFGVFMCKINKMNYLSLSLIGASLWVILEYVRSWFVAFAIYGKETLFGPHHTYYSLGYASQGIPFLKQLLPAGGMYLASFIIILINFFIYAIVFKNKKERKNISILCIIIATFLSLSYLTNYYNKNKNIIEETIPFIIVGAHIPTFSSIEFGQYRDNLSKKILNDIKEKNVVIVFPENFNPYSNDKEIKKQNSLVMGSFNGEGYGNMYFWETVSSKMEHYKKQLLMPVGEYNVAIISMITSFNDDWKYIYEKNKQTLKNQSGTYVYKYKNALISGSLCSENISPYLYRESVLKGATILVNSASHAPFHGSELLARQTLAVNTVRALETGRYFVTASNFSDSFVVSDEGKLLEIFTPKSGVEIFSVDVVSKDYITLYVRYGDYMVIFSFIIVMLNFIWRHKNKE